MMSNLKVEMSTCPPQNLMVIAVLYQILLVIGDPILLGGFKMDDEVFDQSVLGAIFLGNGADVDFILQKIHE